MQPIDKVRVFDSPVVEIPTQKNGNPGRQDRTTFDKYLGLSIEPNEGWGHGLMSCKRIGAYVLKAYKAEVAVHFSGREWLNKPAVWVFPTMMICHSCGFVEFELPQQQLSELRSNGFAPQGNGRS